MGTVVDRSRFLSATLKADGGTHLTTLYCTVFLATDLAARPDKEPMVTMSTRHSSAAMLDVIDFQGVSVGVQGTRYRRPGLPNVFE